jgi:hypothetical protein
VDEQDRPETADISAGLALAAHRDLAEVVALHCDFPEWGVWFPVQGTWTAARPTSTRPPAQESPMIWVYAESAQQLADQMRVANHEFDGS